MIKDYINDADVFCTVLIIAQLDNKYQPEASLMLEEKLKTIEKMLNNHFDPEMIIKSGINVFVDEYTKDIEAKFNIDLSGKI